MDDTPVLYCWEFFVDGSDMKIIGTMYDGLQWVSVNESGDFSIMQTPWGVEVFKANTLIDGGYECVYRLNC